MGTNYYVKVEPCKCCGHQAEALHIGKSSIGWTFALHAYPDMGLNSLGDWKAHWADRVIEDEYGSVISRAEMISIITERSNELSRLPSGYASWDHFHSVNQSTAGPHGLLRRRISDHCIGHGGGTWDLCVGNYS